MNSLVNLAITQLRALIEEFEVTYKNYKTETNLYPSDKNYYYELPSLEATHVVTRFRNAIQRFSYESSAYVQATEKIVTTKLPNSPNSALILLLGVLKALLQDYEAGYIDTMPDIIRADVFSDFLEMAEHLHEEGYKDAAAVISGSVLEENLRILCQKNNLDVEEIDKKGNTYPKKAQVLNNDLQSNNIYDKGKLDNKSITAWLELRNNAAHGHYDKYSKEQVALMIQGIRDFITRHTP